MSKVILQKDDPQSIEQFTADIIELIEELREILIDIFQIFYEGRCGGFLKNAMDHLFDEWLFKNMNPKTSEIIKFIDIEYESDDLTKIEKRLKSALSEFKKDEIILEILANKRKRINLNSFIQDVIFRLFREKITMFIDQTSIQFVGRYLMLFVGIDKGAWKPITPTGSVSNVFLHYYWIIRNEMYKIVPSIYNLNELDWMYISDINRQGLEAREIKVIDSNEQQLDKYLSGVYMRLKKYNYSRVNSDLWKRVYQTILPKEEINRLGFVTTPDEIVDVILDMVKYTIDCPNLCKLKILDPACGSGTFLINALTRLLIHLDTDIECHAVPKRTPEWEKEEKKLEIILKNLIGIDINPFATFLTTMNLVFMLMDSFSIVHSRNPYFTLHFNILTNDSLGAEFEVPTLKGYTNARRYETIENMRKFTDLLKQEFDLVIGNPPWGIVLKGKLGPLGDEEKRSEYKERFDSATGKYDIYVLFMERGIDLLKDGGLLGFITQVMYVSQDYGEGIQKVIKKSGSIEQFVDIQTLGPYIFPKWTNYPAITIFKKKGKQKKVKLIEVKLK
jgi:hypothetical protein